MVIPKQLQKEEFRFVKIPSQQKGPKTTGWQLEVHNWEEAHNWLIQGFNYGVIGGHGGLIIIDPDAKCIVKIIEEKLPETFTVQTGSGHKHFYFFCPEIQSKIVFNDKLEPIEFLESEDHYGEIMSFGTQCVGPGSIHPDTGKQYEVLKDIEIATVTQEQIFSAFDRFLSPNFFNKKDYKKSDNEWKNVNNDNLPIFDVLTKFGISTEYSGRQLQTSHPIHGSEGGMNFVVNPDKNAWFCFRHNSGGGPISLIAILEGIIDCSEAVSGGLRGKRFIEAKDIAIAKYGLKERQLSLRTGDISEIDKKAIYAQLKKDFFFEDKKGNKKVSPFGIQKIARYFVDNYHIKTVGDNNNREIYFYNDGYYDKRGASVIKAGIEEILEEACTIHYKNEITEKVKDMTYAERDDFIINRNLINLKNGVLNLETNELSPVVPDNLFLYQIPVNYDPTAKCPAIEQFLTEILEENDIKIFYEWLGYSLYRQYFIKKALMLVGSGNTGKTTLLRVFTRFIGSLNISGISLQRIASDKFAAANLYSKHVNIYDDLAFEDLAENGSFKMTTGGGYITGEYKFGDQFIFENFAKLTFSCNKIPPTKDHDDDAYFSRWILIHFNKPIEEKKIDKFILEKILTDQELSGLLNHALTALRLLLKGYDFSYQKTVAETKAEMLKSSSSIAAFVFNCLERGESVDWVSKENLYQNYADFSMEGVLGTETKDKFGKDLVKYAGYIVDSFGTEKMTKKRERGWRNLKVNNTKTATTPIEEHKETEMLEKGEKDQEKLTF